MVQGATNRVIPLVKRYAPELFTLISDQNSLKQNLIWYSRPLIVPTIVDLEGVKL